MNDSTAREYCINIGGKYLKDNTLDKDRKAILTPNLKEALRVRGKEKAEKICMNLHKISNIIAYKFEI